MKVKLTPIPQKKQPKNKYIIEVEFMHGDADHESFEKFTCKNEQDFISTLQKIEEGIKKYKYSGSWNNEYVDFWENLFGEDFVPYDITTNGDIKAQVRYSKGYYFDENGTKFKAELV